MHLVRTIVPLAVIAVGVMPTHAAELSDLTGPNAAVKQVAGDFKFTEGPAWSPKGLLLFSDIPNNRIMRLDADGKVSTFQEPSGRANGLIFDAQGNLYACQGGERRMVKIGTQDGKIEVLADRYDGKPINSPNDLALDYQGGLYFTDPRYGQGPEVEQKVMGVYYIAADGSVTRVIEDLERPNGILVTADGKTLYVAEPNRAEIYRYDITAPGKLRGKKLLFTGEKELDGNGPDGMALDEHGNIYATYNKLVVLSPDGKLIGRIDVPEKPSNCTFGGDDGKTLYITARTSLYALPMQVKGAPLAKSGPKPMARVSLRSISYQQEKQAEKKVKAGDLTLVVPPGWKQEEPSSRLRVAQFAIPPVEGDKEPAEMVISHFGGEAGGIAANVKRWIGQFQPEGRTSKLFAGASPHGKYVIADVSGTYNQPVGPPIAGKTRPMPGARMIGVILAVEGKGNYFLKLTGPQKTVAEAADDVRLMIGADVKQEKPYEE